MEQLTVLTYQPAEVHIYNVAPDAHVDEEYLKKLGYNPNECFWMFGENVKVVEHKDTLM